MIFKRSEIEKLCHSPRPHFRRESALLNQEWVSFSFQRFAEVNHFLDRFFSGESFSEEDNPHEISLPYVTEREEGANFTVLVKRFSIKAIAQRPDVSVLRLCTGNLYGDARFFINGNHVEDSSSPHEAVTIELNREALHSSVLSIAICIESQSDLPWIGIGRPFWMEFCGNVFLNCLDHRYENGVSQLRLSFSSEPSGFRLRFLDFNWELTEAEAQREEATEFVFFLDYRKRSINPPEWTPSEPHLLNLEIDVYDSQGRSSDRVCSYIGLRTVSVSQSFLLLNGRPFYLKGVIHSGLYEEDLPYPSTLEGYLRDMNAIKNLGFNTVRLDSRIESPIAYFCADALGLAIWQDFPQLRALTDYDVEESKMIIGDYLEILKPHPGVLICALFNENKGLPRPLFKKKLILRLSEFYSILKTKSSAHLIVDNSGFYHHTTDILDLHCLTNNLTELHHYLDSINQGEYSQVTLFDFRRRLIDKLSPQSEWVELPKDGVTMPVILSEMGGIFIDSHPKEETIRFLKELFDLVYSFSFVKGFCFRQFSDTKKSSSGILSEERLAKGAVDFWKGLIQH